MSKVILAGKALSYLGLVTLIYNYSLLCNGDAKDSLLQPEARKDNDIDIVEITIANKYFTAVLMMHMVDSKSASDTITSSLYNDAEGVIISVGEMNEFDINGPWAALGSRLAEDNCPLRIITFNKSEEGISPELMEWSLDHGFECIPIDAADPVFGWQEREKEGLPRLMEALQSQMWSSMVKNASAAKPFTLRSAAAMSRLAESIPEVPPSTSSSSSSSATAVEEPSASLPAPPETATICPEPSAAEKPTVEEENLDQFADMLAQARSLREDVQRGALSDQDRRNKAAEMALKLCAMMNFDESDEEDNE